MSEEQLIKSTALASLTGLTETEIDSVARAGYLPRISRGQYPIAKAVQGLFRWARERAEKKDYVFVSMLQCSSATGVPLTVLKAAKSGGCDAFDKANRVDLSEFLKWYFSHAEETKDLLDGKQESAKLAKARREAQEIENAEKLGQLHSRDSLEELLWENTFAPLRAGLLNYRKVIIAQVDQELERGQVPLAVREAAKAIAVDALTKMLADIRAAYPTK